MHSEATPIIIGIMLEDDYDDIDVEEDIFNQEEDWETLQKDDFEGLSFNPWSFLNKEPDG